MCVQPGGSHCGNCASLGIVDIAWETFQKQALPRALTTPGEKNFALWQRTRSLAQRSGNYPV